MTEKRVAIVNVIKGPSEGFRVTVPKRDVGAALGLRVGQKLEVSIDLRAKRWSYTLLE